MIEAVLTVAEMRAAEQAAISAGVSEWELMRRAGEGAAQWVIRAAAGRPVTVLCGPGNNGGDGYVIAEVLYRKGYKVHVIAPLAPRAATAERARAGFSGEVVESGPLGHGVIVDCLFGYGLARRVEGAFENLLQDLAASDCFKIAIDVPSAVESDTGEALGPLPRYDMTIALGAWKQAHFAMPATASMGLLRLVPIGLDLASAPMRLSDRARLDPPSPDAHKYRRGLLAILSGSMPGAPLLAAEAAMRAGAGYVKLLSEHSHPDAPAELVIENHAEQALEDARNSALLFGPGAGREEAARASLAKVLAARRPTVLDADALHLLDPASLVGGDPASLCVTPHEGELAALARSFGLPQASKLDTARALHEATGMTVLAKGPDTILVGQGGQVRFFRRGSSWLSVAGTGDVLAGTIASRLATHGDPFRAAEEGVWLHHEAARLAGPAFTAGELARTIKLAYESFL